MLAIDEDSRAPRTPAQMTASSFLFLNIVCVLPPWLKGNRLALAANVHKRKKKAEQDDTEHMPDEERKPVCTSHSTFDTLFKKRVNPWTCAQSVSAIWVRPAGAAATCTPDFSKRVTADELAYFAHLSWFFPSPIFLLPLVVLHIIPYAGRQVPLHIVSPARPQWQILFPSYGGGTSIP